MINKQDFYVHKDKKYINKLIDVIRKIVYCTEYSKYKYQIDKLLEEILDPKFIHHFRFDFINLLKYLDYDDEYYNKIYKQIDKLELIASYLKSLDEVDSDDNNVSLEGLNI